MVHSELQIDKCFPIPTQTSISDKNFLLNAIEWINQHKDNYAFVEIGSFLGGSIAPFLMDSRCTLALSIDERERLLDDERGAKFDYSGITSQTMINNLSAHGISTVKLKIFDGAIDLMQVLPQAFDLAFIDGEHTDFACFRDFIWLLPMMKADAVVMFHDSTLIYKTLRLVQLYLKKFNIPFQFIKKENSEMSAIFLGAFANADITSVFGAVENPQEFYLAAENSVINHLLKNRIVFQYSAKIIPAKTQRSF